MFTTRIVDEKDKDNYHNFIINHAQGHFLQLLEWGRVKEQMGWEPLPLVLEEDGEIKASILLLKKRLPIPLLNKCILYSPRGPVIDLADASLFKALNEGISKVAKEEGAILLKIDPDVAHDDMGFANLLIKNGFKKNETGLDFEGVQPNFVFRLDITPDEDTLLANMHSKWRYNIRLASRRGVTIREANSKDDLKVFYDILVETAKRDDFLIRGYEYFEWIWDYLVENDYAQIFLADYEGEVISATLALITGNKAWYLYGASSNDYRNVMPNYLIQWTMIKWAKAHNATLYDFRGVSGDLDEDNPLYGLYRFKKGFGGDFTEFIGEWDQVYSPFFYFLWNKALPIYLNILRGKS